MRNAILCVLEDCYPLISPLWRCPPLLYPGKEAFLTNMFRRETKHFNSGNATSKHVAHCFLRVTGNYFHIRVFSVNISAIIRVNFPVPAAISSSFVASLFSDGRAPTQLRRNSTDSFEYSGLPFSYNDTSVVNCLIMSLVSAMSICFLSRGGDWEMEKCSGNGNRNGRTFPRVAGGG